MVGVAQLVEPRVVIPVVVGSSPIVHPTFSENVARRGGLLHFAVVVRLQQGLNVLGRWLICRVASVKYDSPFAILV